MARVGVYHRTKESVIGGGGRAGVEDFGYVIIVFIWSSFKASWYSESPPPSSHRPSIFCSILSSYFVING